MNVDTMNTDILLDINVGTAVTVGATLGSLALGKLALDRALDKHYKWLCNEEGGERADLSGAYLRGAYLSGANLSGANLSNTYLVGASLSNADLRNTDLSNADLRGAYLSNADLRGAYLSGANLSGANFINIKIEKETLDNSFPICCPEYGSFIAWKKADNKIIKLRVTDDAKRSSAFGRKCRCSKAMCLSIEEFDGSDSGLTEISSDYDKHFVYRVGEIAEVEDFDDDRAHECAPGIHFFITRNEAVRYE